MPSLRWFILCSLCAVGFFAPGASAAPRPTPPGGGCILRTRTLRGEVLDLACYVDSGARGPKHADCARVCINHGQPVGLLSGDGKVYVVAGRQRSLNSTLAGYAGQRVALRGQVATRDGINLLENAELVAR